MFRFKKGIAAIVSVALLHVGSIASAQTPCVTDADIQAALDAHNVALRAYSDADYGANFFQFTQEYHNLQDEYERMSWACRMTPNPDPRDVSDCQDAARDEIETRISDRIAQLEVEAADAEMAMNAAWAAYLEMINKPRCEV